MSGENEQQEEAKQPAVDTEASDLRELHLSATFLTPYAVAPTQDNQAWLSNTQQAFVDHTKQGEQHGFSCVRPSSYNHINHRSTFRSSPCTVIMPPSILKYVRADAYLVEDIVLKTAEYISIARQKKDHGVNVILRYYPYFFVALSVVL